MNQPVICSDNRYGAHAKLIEDSDAGSTGLLLKYSGKSLADFSELGVAVCMPTHNVTGADGVACEDPVYTADSIKNTTSIHTGNAMGVLHFRDKATGSSVVLQINSRFDTNSKQHFLIHLLSHVFGGVFLDQDIASDQSAPWDILLALMFRKNLIDASAVGLYRQYMVQNHNDMRYRGKFDIDTHIKHNNPFVGNIAYITREISYDNPLNHLLRHAIDRISQKWPWLLSDGGDLAAIKRLIANNTPSWAANEAWRSVRDKHNLKPLRHPFYAPFYEPLRLLALAILHEDGANPWDASVNEVDGFLFDGAWLWEEYLATLLCPIGFMHPRNRESTGAEYLFIDAKEKIYPDFWKKGIVLDAKYKRLNRNVDRKDLYQLISYMHTMKAPDGLFLYPCQEANNLADSASSQLEGLGGCIGMVPFYIPQGKATYKDFLQAIEFSKQEIFRKIKLGEDHGFNA